MYVCQELSIIVIKIEKLEIRYEDCAQYMKQTRKNIIIGTVVIRNTNTFIIGNRI